MREMTSESVCFTGKSTARAGREGLASSHMPLEYLQLAAGNQGLVLPRSGPVCSELSTLRQLWKSSSHRFELVQLDHHRARRADTERK